MKTNIQKFNLNKEETMTRDELKKEFLKIKDVDTICNIFALILVGSRGVFFSKKAHKKLANYVATFPTTSNELSDEEYKLKITTDVTLFGIDNFFI